MGSGGCDVRGAAGEGRGADRIIEAKSLAVRGGGLGSDRSVNHNNNCLLSRRRRMTPINGEALGWRQRIDDSV